MHKTHYHVKPCANKYLKNKWDDEIYNHHLRKLAEARPIVNTTAPMTHTEERRQHEIEKDNRILLEKIAETMRKGGRCDNKNFYLPISLNMKKRQLELLKVCRENQAMAERVLNQKPFCSMNSWRNQWRDNLIFMNNISQFPHEWWKMGIFKEKEVKVPPQIKNCLEAAKSAAEAAEAAETAEAADEAEEENEAAL